MPPQKPSDADVPWGSINEDINIKEEIIDVQDECVEDYLEMEIKPQPRKTTRKLPIRSRKPSYNICDVVKKPYKCTVCAFRCQGLKYLHAHLTKFHCETNPGGKVKCTKCSFETTSKLAFFHHILSRDTSQCPPKPCDTTPSGQDFSRKCPNCLYGTLDEVEGKKEALQCWVCHYGKKNGKELDDVNAEKVVCVHCHKAAKKPARCLMCLRKFHVSCLLQAASTAGVGKCKHELDPTHNVEYKKVKRRTKMELWLDGIRNPYSRMKNNKMRRRKKIHPVEDKKKNVDEIKEDVIENKEQVEQPRVDRKLKDQKEKPKRGPKRKVYKTKDETGGVNDTNRELISSEGSGNSENVRLLKRIIKELEEKNTLLMENCELWKYKALHLEQKLDEQLKSKSNGIITSTKEA